MTQLPHIPACCPDCYALCNPGEQAIARIVMRLMDGQKPKDAPFYLPTTTPLCKRGEGQG